jgi:hypothetical protein
MSKTIQGVLFGALLVATILVLDLSFFRHHTMERLLVNVGVVLVYPAFYFRFFKKS